MWRPIRVFIGVRAKYYLILSPDGTEEKMAISVSKVAINKRLDTIFTVSVSVTIVRFQRPFSNFILMTHKGVPRTLLGGKPQIRTTETFLVLTIRYV